MRLFIFKSEVDARLRAFAGDLDGSKLPAHLGPGARSVRSHPIEILRISSRARKSKEPSINKAFGSGA